MHATPPNPTPPPAAADAPTALSDSSFILPPPSLSDPDRSLLTTLFDPTSDLPATAAALGLDLLDLAHWLAQPHIQAQLELIESLRALRRELWAEQLRHEAAEALREALRETGQSAPDPAERRRCANTLLRATSQHRARPQSPGLQPGLGRVRTVSAHADRCTCSGMSTQA